MLKNEESQKFVFEYIEKEDTQESVTFITQAVYKIGFNKVNIIHKTACLQQ